LQNRIKTGLFLEIRRKQLSQPYYPRFVMKKVRLYFEMGCWFLDTPSDLIRLYQSCNDHLSISRYYTKGVNWIAITCCLLIWSNFTYKIITNARAHDQPRVCLFTRRVLENYRLVHSIYYAIQIRWTFNPLRGRYSKIVKCYSIYIIVFYKVKMNSWCSWGSFVVKMKIWSYYEKKLRMSNF